MSNNLGRIDINGNLTSGALAEQIAGYADEYNSVEQTIRILLQNIPEDIQEEVLADIAYSMGPCAYVNGKPARDIILSNR